MEIVPGTQLGRYEIRSKIGEGGMGEVYLAEDAQLRRRVALKILPTDLAANQDRMRRFVQEAQAAAALNHPHALAQSKDARPYMMPTVQATQSLLAYRRGDYAQAKANAEKALATAQANGLANYLNIQLLTQSLNKLGQAKRAESLLLKEIERLKQSEKVFDMAKLKSVLGESLTAQRRFAEAEKVLLEAYDTQKSRVLSQQYDLIQTRQRLVELYRAWGKPDEARKYESEPTAVAGG